MTKKARGTWIKLYHEFTESVKFGNYVHGVSQGRKTKAQRRIAADRAYANAVRLYLTLGRTEDGVIDCREPGGVWMLTRGLEMEEDELIETLDQMAEYGIINSDGWKAFRVVKTTNSEEQGKMRAKFKERSDNANNEKKKNP